METLKEFVKEYGIWFSIGAIATKFAFSYAAGQRGTSLEIGGEILVLPAIMLIVTFCRQVKDDMQYMFIDEEEDDDEECDEQ